MGDLKYPETIIRAAMDDCVLCKGKVPCDHHRPLFHAIAGYGVALGILDDRIKVLEREVGDVADRLEAAEKEADQ